MCFNLCKKYKEQIKELQKINDNISQDAEDCYSQCEKKDKIIVRQETEINRLKRELLECKNGQPSPNNKAIKSIEIKNGKFSVNGKETKLLGISKREMLAVGSGDLSDPKHDYSYAWIKQAIKKSKANYIRVIIPKNIAFAKQEIKDYLASGIVVEVELFDAGYPNRPYQAHWKDTFDALKDLPVFFDSHNEFCDRYHVNEVVAIINYVTSHGGLIGAGAWGSSAHGKEYAEELKQATSKYQIVTHHRQWTKTSIDIDREAGKPLICNELHTRDHNLKQIKSFMKMMYQNSEGIQVYSLLNFGWGEGSNFQKLLDFVGEIQ